MRTGTERPGGAFARQLRETIAGAVDAFEAPGAQVAWLWDDVVEQVETGLTGVGGRRGVAPETRFQLGSVTKAFTASLAMQLVSDDLLALDGPIGDVMSSGPCRDVLGELSLRQLLSHTSGMENDHPTASSAFGSTREYVRSYRDARPLFPPGEHFSYANAGYVVVGHLIECVTGRPWAETMQAFLLDPLEVRGSFFLSESVSPGLMADGHVRRNDGEVVRLPSIGLGRAWAPAGGLALSAAGVMRLVQLHLRDGRTSQGFPLLEQSLVAEMRSDQATVPDTSFADAWGLGWALVRQGPTVWFGHDGDAEGFTAFVRASCEDGFAVVMVANCIPSSADWGRLLAALAGLGLEVGDPVVPAPREAMLPVDPGAVGHYENGSAQWTVERRRNGLYLVSGDLESMPLRAIDADRCVAVSQDGAAAPLLVALVRDEDHQVQHLHLGGRLARRTA
jgi:CubicO group peptidase (beta-lactamase class C family)